MLNHNIQLEEILEKNKISGDVDFDSWFRIPGTPNKSMSITFDYYGRKCNGDFDNPENPEILCSLHYYPTNTKREQISKDMAIYFLDDLEKENDEWRYVNLNGKKLMASPVIKFNDVFNESLYNFISSKIDVLISNSLITKCPTKEELTEFTNALARLADNIINRPSYY